MREGEGEREREEERRRREGSCDTTLYTALTIGNELRMFVEVFLISVFNQPESEQCTTLPYSGCVQWVVFKMNVMGDILCLSLHHYLQYAAEILPTLFHHVHMYAHTHKHSNNYYQSTLGFDT